MIILHYDVITCLQCCHSNRRIRGYGHE